MAEVLFGGKPVQLLGNEVRVGDPAPEFTVIDQDLNEVHSSKWNNQVRLIASVPSIDTGVCDAETRRFNEEAANLPGVQVITISADLPFAQKRWCAARGIENLEVLSDHRNFSFGDAFGVHMKDLRLLARAVFVIDSTNTIVYKEIVSNVHDHPDYEKAIQAAKNAE